MADKLKIFRKRYVPDELVDISQDEVLFLDSDLMVTKWDTIHPRGDIARGLSFTFLKEGYKVSKVFDFNNELVYWYCDIIDSVYDQEDNVITIIDLLVDVRVMPDGRVMVLDVEEIAQALEQSMITQEQACDALKKLSKLLEIIYYGIFPPKECEKWLNC
jgi:predicted RNA-binding protein associated with RNAse of E/G family